MFLCHLETEISIFFFCDPMKSWVTVPNFKREYFKLLNGENFTSTWIALRRSYTLIISREKNFISEFWVRAKIAISAGLRRAVTGARPGFGTRPAARLRRTRPGRASACDRRPGFGTRRGFGAHDRARFRHAACSTDPP